MKETEWKNRTKFGSESVSVSWRERVRVRVTVNENASKNVSVSVSVLGGVRVWMWVWVSIYLASVCSWSRKKMVARPFSKLRTGSAQCLLPLQLVFIYSPNGAFTNQVAAGTHDRSVENTALRSIYVAECVPCNHNGRCSCGKGSGEWRWAQAGKEIKNWTKLYTICTLAQFAILNYIKHGFKSNFWIQIQGMWILYRTKKRGEVSCRQRVSPTLRFAPWAQETQQAGEHRKMYSQHRGEGIRPVLLEYGAYGTQDHNPETRPDPGPQQRARS